MTAIGIRLVDKEAQATLIRLCQMVGMPAVPLSEGDTPPTLPFHLVEEDGCLMLRATAEPAITLAQHRLPASLHAVRGSLISCWEAHCQQRESLLPLGGHAQLDMVRRHISHPTTGDIYCELTEKETELLAQLYHAGEAGEDKETLLAAVWHYHPEAETRTLDSHLYRLRQKLADLPPTIGLEIISQQGVYRLGYAG
jgi:Transcriptional regulatory protein, C terminal